MTRIALALVLLPALALAEPSDQAVRYAATAHNAARAGNCEYALEIGERISRLDPDFHAQTFVHDEAIAACIAGTPLSPPLDHSVHATLRPLSRPRVAGEILGGALAGAGGFCLGALLGAQLERRPSDGDPGVFATGTVLGALVGTLAGVPLGIAAVGNTSGEHGSFLAALAGTALGGGAGIAVVAADGWSARSGVALAVLPVLGGVVGFNLTRRTRELAPIGSLVVVRDGAVALGAPIVTHANATTHVSLLSGTF